MEQLTPLYDQHVALGAKMAPFAGYLMPIRYIGDTAEHLLVRQGVGVFDVSHMGEFLVRGPKALALIQSLTTNDVSKVPVGKAQYNTITNDQGGIVDDLIVYHLEDELYLMVVNAANVEKDWNWLNAHNAVGAELENISSATALIAVSGPRAIHTVQKLTDLPVAQMGNYECLKGKFAGLENILIATTGYTGERTYEIFVRNEDAAKAWDAIFSAGSEFDIKPAGLAARDTLRLEMGYMLYGNDINDETSPISAGLNWITKLDKGDFTASKIIAEHKAKGTPRKLIAFETQDKGIPRQHYPIAIEGKIVGEVTSGTFSPSLKKGIGMGYVDAEYAKIGTSIDIMVRDKAIKSEIVKTPFMSDTSVTEWYKKK